MSEQLTENLRKFVAQNNIYPDPYFEPYKSGVYAVVDCFFSSQARYATVMNAIQRLDLRLPDTLKLTFTEFLNDINQIGMEKYAANVLTRQQLGRRLKVEVCCNVAQFFVQQKIETLADFQLLSTDRAEKMILNELVVNVKGVGDVLARYLLILMGREDHVKPDTLLTRLLLEVSGQAALDIEQIRQAVSSVALENGTTPARLDNALWKFESSGRKPLNWVKTT